MLPVNQEDDTVMRPERTTQTGARDQIGRHVSNPYPESSGDALRELVHLVEGLEQLS